MCVPNLVPIGPQTAMCIRLEGYTHRHTLSYIDIDECCQNPNGKMCVREISHGRVKRGKRNKQGRMEEEANQLYWRPQMTGQATDEEKEEFFQASCFSLLTPK